MPATTSCEVGPAGLSTSQSAGRTAAAASAIAVAVEAPLELAPDPVEQLVGVAAGAEAGRGAVAAAAAQARDLGDVHVGIGRPEGDPPGPVRPGLAHEDGRTHAADGAQRLDDVL